MTEVPHPRVLFESVPDEALLERLAALVPVHGLLGDDVREVHPSDWDLVVSFDPQPVEPSGVHLLSFGGTAFVTVIVDGWEHMPRRDHVLHARSVAVAGKVSGQLRSLVERSIVDHDPGPGRDGLSGLPWGESSSELAVAGAEREPWAAVYIRDGHSRVWALPKETTDHVEWLSAVLKSLQEVDPERFPGSPDWKLESRWGTPETRKALAALTELEDQRAALLRELAAREARVREDLELSVAKAADGAQRALTADGPELESAVAGLLSDLGFEVQGMDPIHQEESGGRLEDLRVCLPGETWVCLVEVKGYKAGAKVSDVSRIVSRPSVKFAATEGRAPDAVWHVVNAWRNTDPETREVAVPQAHDLAVLTAAGGCLIDTRDLFRAWRDVREREVEAHVVRDSMRGAVTRWSWPPPASAPPALTSD